MPSTRRAEQRPRPAFAIELVAAHCYRLSAQAILDSLSPVLDVAVDGPRDLPARQQTLRATIAWSYDLLDKPEQCLFRCLAVFAGGCTVESAEAVYNSQGERALNVSRGLTSLTDKSLLRRVPNVDESEGPRYEMLETIREFALERLTQSGEAQILYPIHANYFLALAGEASLELRGPQQRVWLQRLRLERDNLRTAMQWSLTEGGKAARGLQLVGALEQLWFLQGNLNESRCWLKELLAASDDTPDLVRAQALRVAGNLAYSQNDLTEAHMLLDESIALGRQLGNKQTLADALMAKALTGLFAGEGSAEEAAQEAAMLFREVGDEWGLASALSYQGKLATWRNDFATARTLFQDSIIRFEAVGDRWSTAPVLRDLGLCAYREGDYQQARDFYEANLAIVNEMEDKGEQALTLQFLGDTDRVQGNYEQAAVRYEQGLALFREMGMEHDHPWCLYGLGVTSLRQGDYWRVAGLLEECLQLLDASNHPLGVVWVTQVLAYAMLYQGEYLRAQGLFCDVLRQGREREEHAVNVTFCLPGLATLAAVLGLPERAAYLFGVAEAARSTIQAQGQATDIIDYEERLAIAQAHIRTESWSVARASGQTMTLAEVSAYALEGLAEPDVL